MAQTREQVSVLGIFQKLKTKASRLLDLVAQSEGMTPLQCCVLLEVSQGDTSVGTLSERTGMGQANASTLCKKLEQAGYLTRTRNPKDERMVLLALTERGAEKLARVQAKMKEYERAVNGMPQQVMEDLLRGLKAADLVLDHLNEQFKGV